MTTATTTTAEKPGEEEKVVEPWSDMRRGPKKSEARPFVQSEFVPQIGTAEERPPIVAPCPAPGVLNRREPSTLARRPLEHAREVGLLGTDLGEGESFPE